MTTVIASANSLDRKSEPSGTNTIGESTIHDMPNADEHFQSLLPLVPGVVRGPNGQFTRALKLVSGWIPARVGSDEGGAISAFALTGFSPLLGLSLALTRRVRDLLWALIGILWFVWNSRVAGGAEEASTGATVTILKEIVECRQ